MAAERMSVTSRHVTSFERRTHRAQLITTRPPHTQTAVFSLLDVATAEGAIPMPVSGAAAASAVAVGSIGDTAQDDGGTTRITSSNLNPLAREFRPSGSNNDIVSTPSESYASEGCGAAEITRPLPTTGIMVGSSRLNPNARAFVPPSLVNDAVGTNNDNDNGAGVVSYSSPSPWPVGIRTTKTNFVPMSPSTAPGSVADDYRDEDGDSPSEGESSGSVPPLPDRDDSGDDESEYYLDEYDGEEEEWFVEEGNGGGGCGCGIFPPEGTHVASTGHDPRHRSTPPPPAENHAAAAPTTSTSDGNYYGALPDWDDDDSADDYEDDDDDEEGGEDDDEDDTSPSPEGDDGDVPPRRHWGDHRAPAEEDDDAADGIVMPPPLVEIVSDDDDESEGEDGGAGRRLGLDPLDDFLFGRGRRLLSREQVLALPEVEYDGGGGASVEEESAGGGVPATGGIGRPQVEGSPPEESCRDSVMGDGCCAICLEDFRRGERVRVLPACRHAFHTEHIMPWLTGGRGCCPLCKTDVLDDERGGGAAFTTYLPPIASNRGSDVRANANGNNGDEGHGFSRHAFLVALDELDRSLREWSARLAVLHSDLAIPRIFDTGAWLGERREEVDEVAMDHAQMRRRHGDAIRRRLARNGSSRRRSDQDRTRVPRIHQVRQRPRPRRPRGGFTHRHR